MSFPDPAGVRFHLWSFWSLEFPSTSIQQMRYLRRLLSNQLFLAFLSSYSSFLPALHEGAAHYLSVMPFLHISVSERPLFFLWGLLQFFVPILLSWVGRYKISIAPLNLLHL